MGLILWHEIKYMSWFNFLQEQGTESLCNRFDLACAFLHHAALLTRQGQIEANGPFCAIDFFNCFPFKDLVY